MNKIKLDREEKELLELIENSNNIRIENKNEINKYVQLAKKELKRRSISIRLPNRDIDLIKAKAIEEWLPYQTLIGSIIHKYVNWKLKA